MELYCRNGGTCRWDRSLRTLLLAGVLGFWIQRASGQESPAGVITAKVGDTVTIAIPVTGEIITYTWYRGTAVGTEQAILTYTGPGRPPILGPQYTGRETGLPDGSLQITDVLTNYTGNYTRNTISVDAATTLTRQLTVYERVSQPTVSINVSQPIENQPVALTCDNSTTATTILWFFNNSPLQTDNNRITLSAGNKTLTFSRVSRSDDGSYRCEAKNPVSSLTSDPQTVTVSYGPDLPLITPSQNVEVKVGTELRLTCTAASNPAAQYQWLHNDTNINNPHSTYTKASSAFDDSGSYTCLASNSITGLSTNASAIVKVSVTGPPGPGISGGAIAGIVVAVVAVVIAVIVSVWYFFFKRPASSALKGEHTESNGTSPPSNPNASASGKANGPAEDIQYTTVKFAPKTEKVVMPAAPEGTVYSEVRRK